MFLLLFIEAYSSADSLRNATDKTKANYNSLRKAQTQKHENSSDAKRSGNKGEREEASPFQIACYSFFGSIACLTFLIIVLGCIYPNRLYRTGICFGCCFCCCSDKYNASIEYYQTHIYKQPCSSRCDNACNFNCSREGGAALGCLLVLLFPLFLLYILITMLFTCDADEREWEKGGYRSQLSNDITDAIVDKPKEQTLNLPLYQQQQPIMQAQTYDNQNQMQPQIYDQQSAFSHAVYGQQAAIAPQAPIEQINNPYSQ